MLFRSLGNYMFRVAEAVKYNEDTIFVIVRASSPIFWERMGIVSKKQVTVILEDGTRLDRDTERGEGEAADYTVLDSWDIFHRDIRIYIDNVPCQVGDWVTVELEFPLGTISLSARISEREV